MGKSAKTILMHADVTTVTLWIWLMGKGVHNKQLAIASLRQSQTLSTDIIRAAPLCIHEIELRI